MRVFLWATFGDQREVSLYHLYNQTREECVIIACRCLKPFNIVVAVNCMHTVTTLSATPHSVVSAEDDPTQRRQMRPAVLEQGQQAGSCTFRSLAREDLSHVQQCDVGPIYSVCFHCSALH